MSTLSPWLHAPMVAYSTVLAAWLALVSAVLERFPVYAGSDGAHTGGSAQYVTNGTRVLAIAQPLSDNVELFYGIPFAEPPIHALRFQAPQPLRNAPSTLDKTTFERGCMQGSGTTYSEDCLYLNIYRPRGYGNNASLPVFVFLYGGSFFGGQAQGTNATSIMEAALALDQPFIFITTNYRLGPFGFGYGEQYLSHHAANAGLLDVVAALQWVNQHIASFGGDASRVTLGGSSAGAVATSLIQYVQDVPPLAGLFLESGSAEANPLALTSEGYPEVYPRLVNLTGCGDPTTASSNSSSFECLRSLNATVLNDAAQTLRALEMFKVGFPWNPSVDRQVLVDFPRTLLANGTFHRIPVLAGDCEDEGTQFVDPATNTTDQVALQVQLQQATYFDNATLSRLLQLYPDDPAVGSPYNTGSQTFGLNTQFKRVASLYGDLGFQSSRRTTLEHIAKTGYPHLWTWTFDGLPSSPPHNGVGHTSDLDYWLAQKTSKNKAKGVAQMQSMMVQYFLNFLYYSDPSPNTTSTHTSLTHWPRYVEGGQSANMLNLTGNNDTSRAVVVQDTFRQAPIAFINSLNRSNHLIPTV